MRLKIPVYIVISLVLLTVAAAHPSGNTGSNGYTTTDSTLESNVNYTDLRKDWKYSKEIDMTENWDGKLAWEGTHKVFSIQVNTKKLIEQGKVREDCADLRLSWNQKIVPSRVQAGDCGTEETWVYFSNARVDRELLFDPQAEVKTVKVHYGNSEPGRRHESVSPSNDNQATFVHPEGPIEMYYGTHESTTYVNDETDMTNEGVSGGEGYQTWTVDFQSSQYGDQSPDFISISDNDGNRVTESNPGDSYTINGNDYSWIDEGEPISVYFEVYAVESNTVTDNWPVTNRAPNQPNNPDPAQSTGTSPAYSTSPILNVDVSDPDSSDDLDVDFFSGISETWSFGTCGATGSSGPSQSQCDSSYSGTALDGQVNVVGSGIQEWTVPRDGVYRIRAAGAEGGLGDGAVMQGKFNLNQGQTIQILVGQQPSYDGGAGGSFVASGSSYSSANPLVVAGGGAGGDQSYQSYTDGSDSTPGQDSQNSGGGNNGYGGGSGDGGGGGGFYGDGSDGTAGGGGSSFQNGGTGATNGDSVGGFGGGGAAESGGDEAGGAGGYSGGAGADDGSNNGENEIAGGGGSFIDSSATSAATHTGSFGDSSSNDNGYSGTVDDLGGLNTGQGYVTIESEGQKLGEDNSVGNGNTAQFEWTGLTEGQTYEWSARACDPSGLCTNSPSYTFDVSQGPRQPDNPDPADGDTVYAPSGDVTLSARYRHRGGTSGEPGTLTFYNQDGSEIDSCQADHNARCSVTKSVTDGQRYDWYVVAEYNGQTATSDNWYFRTNTPPDQPTNPSPTDASSSVDYNSVTLTADVNDPDGDDMDLTFSGDSPSDSFSQTTSVSGSGEAQVTVNNLVEGETYDWSVEAEDQYGATTTSDTWIFTTNYLPTIDNPQPQDGAYLSSDETELNIDVSDFDGDMTNVRIYDESGAQIGSGSTSDGSEVTVDADYTGLSYGNTYDWTVEAEDTYGTNSRTFSFSIIGGSSFRTSSGINYEYSSVVKSGGQTRFIEYEVSNNNVGDKQLETRLSGPDASFSQYSGDTHTYTLNGGTTKTFRIAIEEDQVGDYDLKITTEDLELGVENTDTIPVLVREYPASGVERVPGLMWVQVLFLVAGATVLYSALL